MTSITHYITSEEEAKQPPVIWQQELQTLDNLIAATQKSLDEQKKLREIFLDYQTFRVQCEQDPNDNDKLLKMVKVALRLHNAIQESHLTNNFDPEFIKELTLFSQIASKKGVPRP